MPPKNILINSTLTAGGNIQIGDNYYNATRDLQHSLLFLRIELEGDDFFGSLSIKSEHATLQDKAAAMIEGVPLAIPSSLWEDVQEFREGRKSGPERMRVQGWGQAQADFERVLAGQLFETFFVNEIGTVIQDFLVLLEKAKIEQLALVVTSQEAAIRGLPWEMVLDRLCHPDAGFAHQPIAFQNFMMVRTMELDLDNFRLQANQAVRSPLKLLFVTALPEDLPEEQKELQIEQEQKKLIEAVGRLEATADTKPKVVIEFLDVASLEEIDKALDARQHDIVHLSGHGSFLSSEQGGILYMEDEFANQHLVTGEELSKTLSGHPSVKLLVLSACETARVGKHKSLAEALAGTNVPAVLSMQFAVSDEGAQAFTTAFYTELAEGANLAAAVAMGRKRLWQRVHDKGQTNQGPVRLTEWFTPVLHLNQYVGGLVDQGLDYELPDRFYTHSTFLKAGHTRLIGQGFVGRKRQRIRLRRHFQQGEHVCLVGLGGMGKTTLAEAFARSYDQESHKVIIWRGAAEITELSILNRILAKYRKWSPNADISELEEMLKQEDLPLTQKLQYLLDNCLADWPVILVFDNFEDLLVVHEGEGAHGIVPDCQGVADLISHMLRHAPPRCRLLFTTRYQIKGLPASLHFLSLDQLSYAEHYRLMNFHAPLRRIGKDDRERIYKRLGGLPRAYTFLAGIVHNDPAFSWAQLEADLGEAASMVFADLMLERIYKLLDPSLQRFFRQASVLIARSPLDALVRICEIDLAAVLKQIELLKAWSLCYSDENAVEVHPLTRAWVQAQGLIEATERREYCHRAAEYFLDHSTPVTAEWVIQYLEIAEDWEGLGRAALGLLDYYITVGIHPRALELCKLVVEKVKIDAFYGPAIANMGKVLHRIGENDIALELLEGALPLFDQPDYHAWRGTILQEIGQIYADQAKWELAIAAFQKSLAIHVDDGDHQRAGDTLNTLGVMAYSMGDFSTAEAYFLESRRLHQMAGDLEGEAAVIANLAQIAAQKGESVNATQHLNRCLEIWKQTGNQWQQAVVCNNLGEVYREQGDHEVALKFLKESYRIAQMIGYRKGMANALNNLAMVYETMDRDAMALVLLTECADHQLAIGDQLGLGVTYNNISQVYFGVGEYEKTAEFLALSLAVRKAISDFLGVAGCVHNLGMLSLELTDYPNAISYLLCAHTMFTAAESKDAQVTAQQIEKLKISVGEPEFNRLLASLQRDDLTALLEWQRELMLPSSQHNLGSESP